MRHTEKGIYTWMTRMAVLAGLWVALAAPAIGQPPLLSAESFPEFEAQLEVAQSFDDDKGAPPETANRDRAVEEYRKALALRPNHKDNIQVEFHIATLLLQIDPATGQKPRRSEARDVLLEILDTYDHPD